MASENQVILMLFVLFPIIDLINSDKNGYDESNAIRNFQKISDAIDTQNTAETNHIYHGASKRWNNKGDIILKARYRRQATTVSKGQNPSLIIAGEPRTGQGNQQKGALGKDFSRRLRNFRRLLLILRAFDKRRQLLSGHMRKKQNKKNTKARTTVTSRGLGTSDNRKKATDPWKPSDNQTDRRTVSKILYIQK